MTRLSSASSIPLRHKCEEKNAQEIIEWEENTKAFGFIFRRDKLHFELTGGRLVV